MLRGARAEPPGFVAHRGRPGYAPAVGDAWAASGRGTEERVAYLIVFLVSLAVGVAVFFAALRGVGPLGAPGFGGGAAAMAGGAPPDPGPGMSYVPVQESRHDWQARLTGVLGLVVSVTVAGIALAISLYMVGLLIGKLFGSMGGGDATAGA